MNPPVYYFLRSKVFRQVTNCRSESPVHPSRGAACSAMVYCRTVRVQNSFGTSVKIFFKSEMYIQTCVQFTFWYIYFSPSFYLFSFGLWRGEGVIQSTCRPAHNRRILNLEVVTLHKRSDSKRVYRPQAFFKKLSLIALIKQIKNKSRSC